MTFYRLLTVVKMIAIMRTGLRAFGDGRTRDLRMAIFDHQIPFLYALLAVVRGWLMLLNSSFMQCSTILLILRDSS